MEMELNREELRLYRSVYRGRQRREETLEAVVPDTMPDVEELLDADGCICLRSKECEDGAVTATLLLSGMVLCKGEGEGGVFAVPLSESVSCRWEDAAILREDQVHLRLELTASDARLLNPRKLLLRCCIDAEAECFREETVSYAVGTAAGEVQSRAATESVSVIHGVAEKTFVVTEEFPLTTSDEVDTILHSRLQCCVEDVREVAGKAVVQGKLGLELLYTLQGQSMPYLQSYTVPFSQLLDTPGEISAARITVMPTAIYAETLPGSYAESGFSLEAHLVAQAVFCADREITYLADAYSTRCPTQLQRSELTLAAQRREIARHVSMRDTLELSDNAERVLWCYVTAERPEEGEGGICRLSAHAHVLYLNEKGRLMGAHTLLRAELESGAEHCCHMALLPQECYASPTGKGLELRMGMEWRGWEDERWTLNPLEGITLSEEEPYDLAARPSLIAVPNSDGDLWALARRYASTVELIESANPGARELGSFLLIPRAR